MKSLHAQARQKITRFRNLKQRGEKKRPLKGTTIIQQRVEPASTKDFMRQMSYERSLPLYTRILYLCLCNPETTKRNSSNLSNALFSSRDLDRETNPQTTQTRGKLDPCGPASSRWFSEKTSERNGNGVKVRRIRRASRPSPNPTKNL